MLTPAAERFVTPLSAAALSAAPVRQDLFSLTDEAEMGHIELSRSADLIVVAPATADLLAKMANGLADDLASTTLLATDKRVLVAPAMNVRMWTHPATQRNVAQLKADGVAFVGPEDGEMACGEFGPGRMSEPAAIVADGRRRSWGATPAGPLAGRHVLVTAGPTYEAIDPVRFIGNRSSGLQGYAIARAARRAGARVTLVSGPVALAKPEGVNVVSVQSARDMLAPSRRRCRPMYSSARRRSRIGEWSGRERRSSRRRRRARRPLHLSKTPTFLRRSRIRKIQGRVWLSDSPPRHSMSCNMRGRNWCARTAILLSPTPSVPSGEVFGAR